MVERNACPNPSAEVVSDGYAARPASGSAWSDLIWITGFPDLSAHGENCISAYAPSGGDGGVLLPTGEGVVDHEQWTVSVAVHAPVGVDVAVYCDWFDGNGTYLAFFSVAQRTSDSATWHRLSGSGLAPTGARRLRPYVNASGLTDGQDIRLDAVRYTPGTDSAYADGDSQEWGWDGDAGASPSRRVVAADTSPAPPPPRVTIPDAGYRVLAQDIRSGTFRQWDVPLSEIEVTETLSGPSEIAGVLSPEIPSLNLSAYDAWSTWLHIEADGQIRASGILQPLSLDEATVQVAAIGPSGYPHGLPFTGEYSGIQVDPLSIVRLIWNHVQSYPDGDLGVTVDDTTSPVRVGTEEQVVDFETGAGEQVRFQTENGPYTLHWWETTDCGSEIDMLARQTPFDYVDVASWNADRSDVDHHIRLGYPRVGNRREHVRFAAGENIVNAVPLAETDDAYASEVTVLGSGEGRERVRATVSQRGDRLRRAVALADKSITSQTRARAFAREELARRQARVAMREITVDVTHPNAPLGTVHPGDDIAVTGQFPWVGWLTVWHRITRLRWSPHAHQARLSLVPSDSVYYGPPIQGAL